MRLKFLNIAALSALLLCGGYVSSCSEENESWAIGTFPGVTDISGTSHIGLWYNAKVVMFNVNVTVSGAVEE